MMQVILTYISLTTLLLLLLLLQWSTFSSVTPDQTGSPARNFSDCQKWFSYRPHYGRLPAIAVCQPLFYWCSLGLSLFSPPNLRGRLADRHQTLTHVRWCPRFIKFGQKFGWPLTPKIWQPKNITISSTSRLDHEYLRNATRHRHS